MSTCLSLQEWQHVYYIHQTCLIHNKYINEHDPILSTCKIPISFNTECNYKCPQRWNPAFTTT